MDLVDEVWEKDEEEENAEEVSLGEGSSADPSLFSSSSSAVAVTRCGFELLLTTAPPASSSLPSPSRLISSSLGDDGCQTEPLALKSQRTGNKNRTKDLSLYSPSSRSLPSLLGEEALSKVIDSTRQEEEIEQKTPRHPSPLQADDGPTSALHIAAVCGGAQALGNLAGALKSTEGLKKKKKRRGKTTGQQDGKEETEEAAEKTGHEESLGSTGRRATTDKLISCLHGTTREVSFSSSSSHGGTEKLPQSSLLYRQGFHSVYLLRSLQSSRYTYIGYSVDPIHRLKQHNGDIPQGGAWKTRRNRPWCLVLVVHGFLTSIAALQFEWRWQRAVPAIDFLKEKKSSTLSSLSKRKKSNETNSKKKKNQKSPGLVEEETEGDAGRIGDDPFTPGNPTVESSRCGRALFERRDKSLDVEKRTEQFPEEEERDESAVRSRSSFSSSQLHRSSYPYSSSSSSGEVHAHPTNGMQEIAPLGEKGAQGDMEGERKEEEKKKKKKSGRRKHLIFSQLEEHQRLKDVPLGGLRGYGKEAEGSYPRYKLTRTGGTCVRAGQRLRSLLILLQSPPFSRMPLAIHVTDSIVGTPFFRSVLLNQRSGSPSPSSSSSLVASSTERLPSLSSEMPPDSSVLFLSSGGFSRCEQERIRELGEGEKEEEREREKFFLRRREGQRVERRSPFLLPPHMPVSYGDASLLLPLVKAGALLAKEEEKERGERGRRRRKRTRSEEDCRNEERPINAHRLGKCYENERGFPEEPRSERGRGEGGTARDGDVMTEATRGGRRGGGVEDEEEQGIGGHSGRVALRLKGEEGLAANAKCRGREEQEEEIESEDEGPSPFASSSPPPPPCSSQRGSASWSAFSSSLQPSSSFSRSGSQSRLPGSEADGKKKKKTKTRRRISTSLPATRCEEDEAKVMVHLRGEKQDSSRRRVGDCCMICKKIFLPGERATRCPACEALSHILCIARTSILPPQKREREATSFGSAKPDVPPSCCPCSVFVFSSSASSSSSSSLTQEGKTSPLPQNTASTAEVSSIVHEVERKEGERRNGFSLVPDQTACVRCKRVVHWGEVLALGVEFRSLSRRRDLEEVCRSSSHCPALPRRNGRSRRDNSGGVATLARDEEAKKTFVRHAEDEEKEDNSDDSGDEVRRRPRGRRRGEKEEEELQGGGGEEESPRADSVSPFPWESSPLRTRRSLSRQRRGEQEGERETTWMEDEETKKKKKKERSKDKESEDGRSRAAGPCMERAREGREGDEEGVDEDRRRCLERGREKEKPEVVIDLSSYSNSLEHTSRDTEVEILMGRREEKRARSTDQRHKKDDRNTRSLSSYSLQVVLSSESSEEEAQGVETKKR